MRSGLPVCATDPEPVSRRETNWRSILRFTADTVPNVSRAHASCPRIASPTLRRGKARKLVKSGLRQTTPKSVEQPRL